VKQDSKEILKYLIETDDWVGLLNDPVINDRLAYLRNVARKKFKPMLLDLLAYDIHILGQSEKSTFKRWQIICSEMGYGETYVSDFYKRTKRESVELIEDSIERAKALSKSIKRAVAKSKPLK